MWNFLTSTRRQAPLSSLSPTLDEMEQRLSAEFAVILIELEKENELLFSVNRKINHAMKVSSQVLYKIHLGDLSSHIDEVNQCMKDLEEIVQFHSNARKKFERLSLGIISLNEIRMFLHFLQTGTLAPFTTLSPCDDEEYIGSTLNLAQQLVRYSSQNALQGNAEAVLFCKSFLSSMQGKYLEFFFRNGPLRKKFDGLKYSVKRIEGIAFDISMVTPSALLSDSNDQAPSSLLGKRPHTEGDNLDDSPQDILTKFENHAFFSDEDMNALKDRLNEFDRLREVVIKKTRDIQKYAKQAVFSLHGKRFSEGREKLQSAKVIADEIKIIIMNNPALRLTPFSNSLEEWIEARLFEEYLLSQRILTRQEIEVELQQSITIPEYIGGLSDLTGEIGRLAVIYGTARDLSSLTPTFRFSECISRVLNEVTITTGKFYSKSNTARQNTTKIEGLIYELTMNLKNEMRSHRPVENLEEGRDPAEDGKDRGEEEEI